MIGGGPIATELAQSMVRLGVPTTVLEMAHRLVPRDEPELADRLGQILRREGVDLHLSTSATAVRRGGEGVVVETDDGEFSAAGLLVATGRTANVQSLGLGELGVPIGPGGIEVDGRNRTLVPSIYVVGDAAEGRADFTHVAAHDAVVAVRDMFFPGRGAPALLTPWCTFTDPELAHAGLTAAEARERHGRSAVTVHRHELAENDRARADGTTDGMILVVTARDKIVGAHALAPAAGELIHELALAIQFGAKLNELSDLVHIYPTLATGIGRIAADRSFETAEKFRSLAKLTRWMG
jgi:pyruvate/2-oxoglutarate dehydrogenase complex dihydrolipoamide dehydrogenase (E3) component